MRVRIRRQDREFAGSRGADAILEGPHLVLEALRLGLRLQPVLATEEFVASAAVLALGAAALVLARLVPEVTPP